MPDLVQDLGQFGPGHVVYPPLKIRIRNEKHQIILPLYLHFFQKIYKYQQINHKTLKN